MTPIHGFIVRFSVVILLLSAFGSHSQAQGGRGEIRGTVADSASMTLLSFASIRVLTLSGTPVDGTLTGDDGEFSIPLSPGDYQIEIDFVGYRGTRLEALGIRAGETRQLGVIPLQSAARTLDEVVVQGEKSTMELALDRKIFNVGKDLSSAGQTASDILMNIPSVQVDAEGGIRLRGSDNVRILIDGKPSGLVSFKGGAGLQQLSASMVERVEIITNPSARYEAEGMAGIINIVLRKERNQGFNGSFEAITGTPLNLGGAANLNYRHKKVNFFVNYSIAYRDLPGDSKLYQELYGAETMYLKQRNDLSLLGFHNNIRGGIDLYFSETSILTGSYLYRRSDVNRLLDIHYDNYRNSLSNHESSEIRRQDEDEMESNSEYSVVYKKTFPQKDHVLTGEIKFLDNRENSYQIFTHDFFPVSDAANTNHILERSINDEFERQLLFQLDYVKPFSEAGKFEVGVRSSVRDMVNDFIVTRANEEGEHVTLPGFDNIFRYDENIHAAYGILANKIGRLSWQAGLRAEWTDVTTLLERTNEKNPRQYMNVFPSAHVTWNLPNDHALQGSYSRRVRRPFYNDLSPFMTYSDSRNYFSGNPDLDPEFSHVVELSHIKYFESGSFTSALYHRNTHGKIERIRWVDENGNSTTFPENLRSEYATGAELTGELSVNEWWKADINLNFFYAEIDGTNILTDYNNTTFSWFGRHTSRFKLPHQIDLQVRTNYEAPLNTAQGRRKSLYYLDVALSKDILKGRGTLLLNALDVLNTRRMRSVTKGPNFYTDLDAQFRRRQINLTFSYRIRQAKTAQRLIQAD